MKTKRGITTTDKKLLQKDQNNYKVTENDHRYKNRRDMCNNNRKWLVEFPGEDSIFNLSAKCAMKMFHITPAFHIDPWTS